MHHAIVRRRTARRTLVVAPLALALVTGALSVGVDAADANPQTGRTTRTALAPASPPTIDPADDRPNIVVVLTDDQRRDTLRYMPAVQRLLVQRGIRFTRAMVPTSLCCPSRATILTGKYAHTTRVFGNGDVGGARYGGWPRFYRTGAERRTIATALHRSGYRTGLFGKYLNFYGKFSRRYVGPDYVPPGWDDFAVLMSNHGSYYNYRLSDGTWHGAEPQDYSTDVFAERAVDFVRSTPLGQPLFMLVAPYGPHSPYLPAPRHVDTMQGVLPPYTPRTLHQRLGSMPRWMAERMHFTQADVDLTRLRQHEALQSVDELVESIDRALAEAGRDRNTLFLFTSDNGYFWGEHRIIGKDSPYQDSTRVPMVLRWDGKVPSGTTSGRIVLNVDIAETVTRAAGVAMATDGISMLGEKRRSGFVLEAMDGYNNRPAYCGWRSRHRMFVRWATGEEELFDYRLDPDEKRNLADKPRFAKVRKRMRGKVVAACVPKPPHFQW